MNDIDETNNEQVENKFESILDEFIQHITSIQYTLPLMTFLTKNLRKTISEKYDGFLDSKGIRNQEKPDTYAIDPEDYFEFDKLERDLETSKIAGKIVPRYFTVALICQFDAFMGNLIKLIYEMHPGKLGLEEKKIEEIKDLTIEKLFEFGSFESFKEFYIDRKRENILRESHDVQFEKLGKLVDTTFTADHDLYKKFIELTQRRHLFVHNNGIISSQYIDKIRNVGCDVSDVIVGCELDVDPEYFKNACNTVLETGVKIAHITWRRLDKKDLAYEVNSVNSIIFDFIRAGNYELAQNLLEYFTVSSILKDADTITKLHMILNKAQVYKWNGKFEKCKEILYDNSFEWDSREPEIKIAVKVLLEKHDEAAQLMKIIGKNGENITKTNYKEFPIFKEFIKTQQFTEAYKEIFEEEFQIQDTLQKKINVQYD